MVVVAVAVALIVAALTGCGGEGGQTAAPPAAGGPVEDPGPVHVHGLGINPGDGALFIATHTGLFRAAEGERTAARVGGTYQDTMGFTVVGPDRFLGSGHPDLRTDQPPYLGLIRSEDAGERWSPVSLHGEADFHVLEASGERVVGYGSDFETRRAQLLVSDDGGQTWSERRPPMALFDLAIAPHDPDLWLAAGDRGLARTTDAGQSWTPLGARAGLLAWPRRDRAHLVTPAGRVHTSTDGGTTWRPAGRVRGRAAAFAAGGDALYVALHSGVIVVSRDGGRTWTVRSAPRG